MADCKRQSDCAKRLSMSPSSTGATSTCSSRCSIRWRLADWDPQRLLCPFLLALEHAERERDPQRQQAWLTFVIVGGGPTGVELAGAIAELVHVTVRGEFRQFDPAKVRPMRTNRV